MNCVSIVKFFFFCVQAQSGSGYNYPSPFNQLTPGTNDLGNVPGVPPSSAFPGSQPGFSNQPFGSQAGKLWEKSNFFVKNHFEGFRWCETKHY